jgi:DNA-binding transcriptional ArsR family regulator
MAAPERSPRAATPLPAAPAVRAGRRRPATEDEARALASAVRLRILRQCLDRALTNKEIASRLDLNPATTLHHVRKLVDTGFLEALEVRRGTRGAREVPYIATGKSWTLDVHEEHAAGSGQAMLDAFLEEVRLVGVGTYRGGHAQVGMTRFGLRLPEDQLEEFRQRVKDLFDEYVALPSDPDAEPYSIFYVIHPDVSRR